MNWLAKLLSLIPVIAQGVQTVHADVAVGNKVQIAQDALSLAIAGSQATLPPDQATLAAQFGALAQTALEATVTTLHNAANPAPVATA